MISPYAYKEKLQVQGLKDYTPGNLSSQLPAVEIYFALGHRCAAGGHILVRGCVSQGWGRAGHR